MAIQAKLPKEHLVNNFWVDFENVYFKIERNELRIDFEKQEIRIPVRGYASKFAREKNANGIYKRVYRVPIPNKINLTNIDDVLTYCYTKLKEIDTELFKNGKDI